MTAAAFLDLSSAFDCPNHELLLSKFFDYGVRGVSYDLMKSYLSGRKQYVCLSVEGGSRIVTSELDSVNQGVPQGAILGPFMFLVYVNIMVQDNVLYCDDTTILSSSSDVLELEIDLNVKVNTLTQSFASHDLGVNPGKTAVMFFKSQRSTTSFEPCVELCGVNLECVESAKVLGIHVDHYLKWDVHVDVIIPKLCSGLYVLRNIARFSDLNVCLSVYYALIQSHIKYGIILWGACSAANLNRVLRMQKKAIRILCNLPKDEPTRSYFKKLKILTAPALYILDLCLLVNRNSGILGENHNYSTRNKSTCLLPKHKTGRFESMPSYRALKFYNHLPRDIREIETSKKFAQKLKVFLTENPIYYLNEFWDN